jgi:hypothetical protein
MAAASLDLGRTSLRMPGAESGMNGHHQQQIEPIEVRSMASALVSGLSASPACALLEWMASAGDRCWLDGSR